MDITTVQRNMEKNWIWQYCNDRETLAWRYFIKEETFVPKCIDCGQIFMTCNEEILEQHLINDHSLIFREILIEFERIWSPQYIQIVNNKIQCKTCNKTFNIFQLHMLYYDLWTHQNERKAIFEKMMLEMQTGINNMFTTVKPPPTKESTPGTSYETATHSRAEITQRANIGNPGTSYETATHSQAEVTQRANIEMLKNSLKNDVYITDRTNIKMEEKDVQDSWLWQYCITQSLTCRYFFKYQMLLPKCKICGHFFWIYDENTLEKHLQNKHPLMLKEVYKEVETVWPQFDVSNNQIKCKVCDEIFNIFRVHTMQQHLLDHDKNEGTQENKENVITTMESPPAKDNSAGTSFQTGNSQVKIPQKVDNGTQKVTKRNNKIISPLTEENAACTSHETDVHSKVTKRGYC